VATAHWRSARSIRLSADTTNAPDGRQRLGVPRRGLPDGPRAPGRRDDPRRRRHVHPQGRQRAAGLAINAVRAADHRRRDGETVQHELGCRIALDDFGTGYGGFTYVKRLPVDYLKIDIEFVRDLPRNDASQHVVRAIVQLARDFGQKTVAEGVEDDETLTILREFGVDYA
jgi:hypothetical protein